MTRILGDSTLPSMSNEQTRPLLTVDDVAKVLRLTPYSVRDYIRKGRIPRVAGMTQIRVRPDDLDAFINDTVTAQQP